MYPISSDILALFQSGAMQYARLTIGTAGQTGYQLIENDRIKQGGFNVNRFAETDDTVKIGSCSAAELTVVLDNRDGVYDDYDFIGKEAKVEVGVDDDGTITYVPFGYFTFDEAGYDKSALRLAALDRMLFFERTIDASQLSFPYTITQLLTRICTVCGVPLGNIQTLLNGGISVPSLPKDAKTYRDLLVWIAEISGNVAYINYDGELMLGWYQGSQFTLTTSNRKNSTLERGTVLVTGVEVVVGENTTLQGTSARTIRVENNPLIPSGQESFIATGLFNKVGGFSYTPFSATVLPMPHIEPLDGCTFVTEDNESVFVPITDWSFNLNGSCSLAGKSNQATYRRGYGLADAILQSTNLADKAVTTAKIADNAVDTAQLAALAVQEGKIAANAVTEGKIAANAVVADKIASNAVTTDKLNALAVTAGKIASGAVTTDKIDAYAVTADKISVTDLSALQATIAGWNIGSDMLYKTITSGGYEYQIAMYAPQNANAGNAAFFVRRRPEGSTGDYTMLWYVAYGGKTYAKDAEIEGKITATSGKIGDVEIENNKLVAKESGTSETTAQFLAETTDRRTYYSANGVRIESPKGMTSGRGDLTLLTNERISSESTPTGGGAGNYYWFTLSHATQSGGSSSSLQLAAKTRDSNNVFAGWQADLTEEQLHFNNTNGQRVYLDKDQIDIKRSDSSNTRFNATVTDTAASAKLESFGGTSEMTLKGSQYNDEIYLYGSTIKLYDYRSSQNTTYHTTIANGSIRSGSTSGDRRHENINTYDNFRISSSKLDIGGHNLLRMTPHFAQMFATEITANANLNTTDYLKCGQYYCTSTSGFTNSPTGNQFVMEVTAMIYNRYDDESGTADAYRIRKITDYVGNQFIQRCVKPTNGSWNYGTWNLITTTGSFSVTTASARKATSATFSDTGLSLTIPASGWYAVSASVSHNYALPQEIAICHILTSGSSTYVRQKAYDALASYSYPVSRLDTSFTGYFDTGDVLKLFARCSTANTNGNDMVIQAKKIP